MATYVLNEAKMFSDIADGVAIVINSETGIYYGMNNFGTTVFENILEGASTEDVVAAIKVLPNAPEDAEARVQAFVKELLAFGILLQGATAGASVNLDAEAARTDQFSMTVQEFSDAQELLLADPIHEVKNDTGWQPDKSALETDEEVVKEKYSKMD